jgi:hypothetical protein
MYRVWARFERDHVNPLTGRRGWWRVTACWLLGTFFGDIGDHDIVQCSDWTLTFPSSRDCRSGSIINPAKELNRVLKARREA